MLEDEIRTEIIKTMHNEHCSYKSTKEYLKLLPTTGPGVLVGPGENAGIVRLGQGLAAAIRIESHNHPSVIHPFQGAATGVGGILRDVFTMGARPIALTNHLRFGKNGSAANLLRGVVLGIGYYGNQVGVAVVGGDIGYDTTYNGNLVMNACAVGIVPEDRIIYGHALTCGNPLIYVGARTGREGVGGATFASSEIVDDERNIHAIQKADPFLENLLMNACVRLARTDWIEGMQDMGAAGLLCSTTEVAHRGHLKTGQSIGARVYLDRIPTKESEEKELTPVEKLISETQERMMIVGKREYTDKILNLFTKWDLEAVEVGEVTNDGNYTLVYTDNGIQREFTMPLSEICGEIREEHPLIPHKPQGGEYRRAPLQTINWVYPRYDWRVGGRTVKGPNQPGKFAILDIEEIGKEIVLSWGADEGRSDLDPYMGVQYAFDTAYRHMKDLGATPLGLTNCLNFGHPDRIMDSFAKTIEGLAQRCREFEVPVVSGNVSLYNAYLDRDIKPTPVLVMVGIRDKS